MNRIISMLMLITGLTLSVVNAMEEVILENKSPITLFDQKSYDKTKQAVLEKFPTALGTRKINAEAITAYRIAFEAIERDDREFKESALVEHLDALIHFAKKALNYANCLLREHPQLSILIKEITRRLEDNDITPKWYSYIGLRIQAAISQPSPEEIELFAHAPNPGENMIKGLYHRDAWKSYEKCQHFLENFQNSTDLCLTYHYDIPHSDHNCIKKQIHLLEKELPCILFYPLFSTGGLDFAFMMENILDEIYPISHSKKNQMAHGIDMTPVSFTIHDYLHTKIDPRRRALTTFFTHELDKQIENGDITLKSAPIVRKYVTDVFAMYKDALRKLFHLHLNKLSTDNDLSTFQRTIAAMHHLFHEASYLSPKVFEESNFKNILGHIAKQAPIQDEDDSEDSNEESSYDDLFFFESSIDPFVTSPIDGSSSLTDSEMIAQLKSYAGASLSDLPDTAPYKIKETKRFIDVTLTSERGEEKHFAIPTLYQKWNNANDYISLLDYAGTKIQKPQLEGLKLRSQRDQVRTMLATIEKEVETLTNDFFKTSIDLSSKTDDINELSLADAYTLKFNELKENYDAQLSTIERIETQAMKRQKELERQLQEANDTFNALETNLQKLQARNDHEQQERIARLKELQQQYQKQTQETTH